MRTTLTFCLILIAIAATADAQPVTAPTTQPANALQPAATPAEAMERSMRAMVEADEAAFRRGMLVRSPEGYSESYVRMVFAAGRLHEAVAEHNVTGERRRDAGFDRHRMLKPGIPKPMSPKEWDAAREGIRKAEWVIDGDLAHIKGQPAIQSGGTGGKSSVERVAGGWVVVLADPVEKAPAEDLKAFAKGWSELATSIDAATERVTSGQLRTIVAVNDFLDAEAKKRKAGDE